MLLVHLQLNKIMCAHVLSHHSASLVVLQVHKGACMLYRALEVVLLSLSGVHELPSEAVSVVDVVPAAAPQPVSGQVPGSSGSAAAAGRELAFPARPAHCIHHTGCTDGVRERCFPAAWRKHQHTQESEERHNVPKYKENGTTSQHGNEILFFPTISDIMQISLLKLRFILHHLS